MTAQRLPTPRADCNAARAGGRRVHAAAALPSAIAASLAVFAHIVMAEPATQHFDPVTGYRIERYQAAVPDTPPAGKRVWIDAIDRLVAEERALLVDVSPITGAGYDPRTGAWRNNKPHASIPGAVWLPEVGRGVIDANIAAYFQIELQRLAAGDTARAIIIFCTADCWMSWNAMKRAAALGYTRLYWFPEGTDGWRDWDRPLAPATPVPLDLAATDTR